MVIENVIYKKILGNHYIIEFYDCKSQLLDNIEQIETCFLLAQKESKANVITNNFHKFEPYGVSGMVIISESHFSIHTWYEHNYQQIDVFVCSEDVKVDIQLEIFKEFFLPSKVNVTKIDRGLIP